MRWIKQNKINRHQIKIIKIRHVLNQVSRSKIARLASRDFTFKICNFSLYGTQRGQIFLGKLCCTDAIKFISLTRVSNQIVLNNSYKVLTNVIYQNK